MEKYKVERVQINVVQNGYIVGDPDRDFDRVLNKPFVFPTFRTLTEWLSEHLKVPDVGNLGREE